MSKDIDSSKRRLAVLIDGDNAQSKRLTQIFEVISTYGIIIDGRAYGDWTASNMANWRTVMLQHAIQPVQQWRYTTGKNATDIALVIDAMDILHKGTVQGFAIVASDSDYTRLCMRMREEGLFVMVIGNRKAPDAFRKSCDVFLMVENLQPSQAVAHKKSAELHNRLCVLFEKAFDKAIKDGNGAASLSALGQAIHAIEPDFDISRYGYRNLKQALQAFPDRLSINGDMVSHKKHIEKQCGEQRRALLTLLNQAFDQSVNGDNRVLISRLGSQMRQIDPDFKTKSFGYSTLSKLILAFPHHFSISENFVCRKN